MKFIEYNVILNASDVIPIEKMSTGGDDKMSANNIELYNIENNSITTKENKSNEEINLLIDNLKNKGVKLAVVTNKFDAAAQEIINKYFPNIFDVVLGETKELNKKPHPDMCNYVLQKLKVGSTEALYVGDSEVDVLTANNANLKTT